MSDDDEIPVESIDSSPVDQPIEIRISGPRGLIVQLLMVTRRGYRAIGKESETKLALGSDVDVDMKGWISSGMLAKYVVESAGDQIDWESLEGIPSGIRRADFEDIPEMVDVELEVLEDDAE